jgi:hypothetical protein
VNELSETGTPMEDSPAHTQLLDEVAIRLTPTQSEEAPHSLKQRDWNDSKFSEVPVSKKIQVDCSKAVLNLLPPELACDDRIIWNVFVQAVEVVDVEGLVVVVVVVVMAVVAVIAEVVVVVDVVVVES